MKTIILYFMFVIPTTLFGQEIELNKLLNKWQTCGYYETLLKKDTLTFYIYKLDCDSLNNDIYEWNIQKDGKIEFFAQGGKGFMWGQFFKPGQWTINQNILTVKDNKGRVLNYSVFRLTDSKLKLIKKTK